MQRTAQDTMSPDRRQRLDALDFVWEPLTAQWEEGVRFLAIFRQREGHCRVPSLHCEQGFRLGSWVRNQRTAQDTLSPDRRQHLDALGFVWDTHAVSWEEGFRSLERYRQREGHCRVPDTHREQGFRLGGWVSEQRKAKGILLPERRQRLDALGFVWDPHAASWEEGLHFLQIFCQREGHCRVPGTYRDPASGFRLGQWAGVQRTAQDTMSPDRRQRLDALDFVWEPLAAQWEEGFRSLERYRQREGHCRVARFHHEQGYRLGKWVSHQRTAQDTMLPDRRQRLEALGFVWKVR